MSSSSSESDSLVRSPQNQSIKPLGNSHSQSPKTLNLTLDMADQTPLDLDRDEDDTADEIPSPPRSSEKVGGFSVYRRGSKRRKSSFQKRRLAQEKKSSKKLEVLIETLNPIPFAPDKALDFSSHEKLLKRLGLWDFVHIEFDREIRSDLLAQLIANFSNQNRGSYVNGLKVMVNRADLARALKLPVKKLAAVSESGDEEEEPAAASEDSIGFIMELVSNWMLLHDDTWMMPIEVMNWMKVIKEGNFDKVDWAGLIWFMILNELMQAPKLVDCYYASHLQCLIKSQREEFFSPKMEETKEEKPKVEVDVKEVEGDLEEIVDFSGDLRMSEVEVVKDDMVDVEKEVGVRGSCDMEEENITLCLGGQGNVVVEEKDFELSLGGEYRIVELVVEKVGEDVVKKGDEEGIEKVGEDVVEKENEDGVAKEEEDARKDVVGVAKEEEDARKEAEEEEKVDDGNLMDFDGCNEENDDDGQWDFEKSGVGNDSFLLRQCSFGAELNKSLGFEDELKHEVGQEEVEEEEEEEDVEEEEEEEEEEEDEEEMEEDQEDNQGNHDASFNLSPKGLSLDGFSSGGLLNSLDGVHMNLGSGMPLHDPSAGDFISQRDEPRMLSHFGNGGPSKRNNLHADDNSHHSLNPNKRPRMDGAWDNGKSSCDFEACTEQIQLLVGKAQALYSAKQHEASMNQQYLVAEVQSRDSLIDMLQKDQQSKGTEIFRLDRELRMMGGLLQSYRNALSETRKAFAEYRVRYPEPHDPLYKDVAGSGGLVVSASELEKLRLQQQEEDRVNRLAFETEIKSFGVWWDEKFTEFGDNVSVLDNKLLSLEEEMKLLKELYATRKAVSKPTEFAEVNS